MRYKYNDMPILRDGSVGYVLVRRDGSIMGVPHNGRDCGGARVYATMKSAKAGQRVFKDTSIQLLTMDLLQVEDGE